MTAVWNFPNRILFGDHVVQQLGSEAKRLGATRVFIVSDPGVQNAGILEPIEKALDSAQLESTCFVDVSSNPLEKEVWVAAEALEESGADLIVAVGGGSALDLAKVVKVAATHPPPLSRYDDFAGGDRFITEPMARLIAVPTTAGTGSEVGRAGVVTAEDTGRKTIIFHPDLLPDVALLDPTLTVTMPVKITAATGFDALTHNIEAYCALGDHPMADAIALEGVRLVVRSLAKVVQDGDDLKSRGLMMKAAMMGAVAFQKGLGACHALAHPLSAEHDLHHGLANALCLPAVLDFNRSAVPSRIAKLAKILGVRGDDAETLAFECAGAIRALRRKVGLPEGLGGAGVPDADLPKLAKLAMEDATHKGNPRPCSEEDMLSMLRASL